MAVKKEPVAPAPVVSDREKTLETAMQQIEKMYGKGSITRYGAEITLNVESIPTGSLSLDLAPVSYTHLDVYKRQGQDNSYFQL